MSEIIKLEDVRKGDRIRATFPPKFGRTISYEGVAYAEAEIFGLNDWITYEGDSLTSFWRGKAIHAVSIELLDRPTPPLPTEPGTIFRATEISGVECSIITFVREHASDPSVRIYVTATPVVGMLNHEPRDITAWKPIDD